MRDSKLWALRRNLAFQLKKIVKTSTVVASLYIFVQSLTRKGSKRAVLFPDIGGYGQSSDLRGYAIAAELKKFGWRVIVVPYWVNLEYRLKVLRRENPDVVVLQQLRHKLNRPELYKDYNTIIDVDDADYVWQQELVSSCARNASLSILGNRHLAQVFKEFGAPKTSIIWTGAYIHSVPGAKPNIDRGDVITWAHSSPQHYYAEAAFVSKLLLTMAKTRKFTFRIYCNKPSWAREYAAPLREAGITVETYGTLLYSKFIKSLTSVSIGLHPVLPENEFSCGKSFGKLLAYMAADVAVVTSNQVDHPMFYRSGENGIMLENNVKEWSDACIYLLDHPAERNEMVRVAREDFLKKLTTNTSASKMDLVMNQFVVGAR